MAKAELCRLNLSPGTEYEFCPYSAKKVDGELVYGRFSQGKYAVVRLANVWPSGQEIVIYRGVGGTDDDNWHACSVHDFAVKFLPVQKEEINAAEPEIVKTAFSERRGQDAVTVAMLASRERSALSGRSSA